MNIFIFLVLLFTFVHISYGGLTVGDKKDCGEITCNANEYCSKTDHRCFPCSEICDKELNNHDEKNCNESCQDYLHERLYGERMNMMEKRLEEDLQTLKILLATTIVITSLVMILLIAILLVFILRRKKESFRNKKFKMSNKKNNIDLPVLYSNNNKYSQEDEQIKEENRNGKTPTSTVSECSEFRIPSESTLPEYYCYENHGLSPSPTHHV